MEKEVFSFDYMKQKDSQWIVTQSSCTGIYEKLFSDQCPPMIRCVRVSDDIEVQENHQFEGCIVEQLEGVFSWLEDHNPKKNLYNGLQKRDLYAFPVTALREALVNAIVHCDYRFTMPVTVRIQGEAIEIISLGGTVFGVSKEDMLRGIHLERNPVVSSIFKTLGYMDGIGCGIARMFAAYRSVEMSPQLYVSEKMVCVTIPEMYRFSDLRNDSDEYYDPMQESVIAYLESHGPTGRSQLEELLSTSPSTVVRLLRKMKQSNLVESTGNGKNTLYYATGKAKDFRDRK